jgi:hypothetical protein
MTMRRLALLSAVVLAACDAGDPLTGFQGRAQPPTQLAVTVQPTAVTALSAISPPVQVQIRNSANQLVASATHAVTMTITPGTGAAGAVLSGQLAVDAVNGVATFNNLRINQAGNYTLTATAAGLTPATTVSFAVNP